MEGFEVSRLKCRIARLKGGVATIKVCASSSMEMLEKKERLDDALNATKAGLDEGIIVGGGIGLLKAITEMSRTWTIFPQWLIQTMYHPYYTLFLNSNQEKMPYNGTLGFNAKTGKMEDLEKAGVYDPVKVTKNSLLAALSIAQLFYSTEVAVLVEE